MEALDWILTRLKEPSTHAALASLFGTLGVVALQDEATVAALALGLVALANVVLGVVLKDGGEGSRPRT